MTFWSTLMPTRIWSIHQARYAKYLFIDMEFIDQQILSKIKSNIILLNNTCMYSICASFGFVCFFDTIFPTIIQIQQLPNECFGVGKSLLDIKLTLCDIFRSYEKRSYTCIVGSFKIQNSGEAVHVGLINGAKTDLFPKITLDMQSRKRVRL